MNHLLANDTLDLIQALDRAPSALKITEIFRSAVAPLGATAFLCSAPPRPDERPTDPILFDGWPAGWLKHYVEKDYILRDPIVRTMFQTVHPFTWDEALKRRKSSRLEMTIMSEAAEWQMKSGFVVPIYSVGGQAYAVTIAGPHLEMDSVARARTHLVAMYAFGRAKVLKKQGGSRTPLTRRQTQSLTWAAMGKSDWEIGEILGLSESTVHKHIEAAKQRFGVPTRVQAIVAALRQGDIQI